MSVKHSFVWVLFHVIVISLSDKCYVIFSLLLYFVQMYHIEAGRKWQTIFYAGLEASHAVLALYK